MSKQGRGAAEDGGKTSQMGEKRSSQSRAAKLNLGAQVTELQVKGDR